MDIKSQLVSTKPPLSTWLPLGLLALSLAALSACGGSDSDISPHTPKAVDTLNAATLPIISTSTFAQTEDTTPLTMPAVVAEDSRYDRSNALDRIPLDDSTRQHLYVSTTGDDKARGDSITQPLRTIQQAAKLATAGTTVHIAAGTYQGPIRIDNQGTLARPIVFKAMEPNTVIVKGMPTNNAERLLTIDSGEYIIVRGLIMTDFWNEDNSLAPTGIYITGRSHHILLEDNYIHRLGTRAPDGNAHGIAVYGQQPITDIQLINNRIEYLKLGFGAAVAVSGDVENFEIKSNTVSHNNNIGIDIIGYEGIAALNDYARRGDVIGNTVKDNSSRSNPAYQGAILADGIYINGGKHVLIAGNKVSGNDIGIEVASEHAHGLAQDIVVRDNIVKNNDYTGIAVGAYRQALGAVKNVTLKDNVIANNDLGGSEGGQLLVEYNVQNLAVLDNLFTNSASRYMIVATNLSDSVFDNRTLHMQGNRYIDIAFSDQELQLPLLWTLGSLTFTNNSDFERCAIRQQCVRR